MSIEIVKDQIRKFISDEDASVMAIKGDWGVGKTYCWNELLKEAKKNDKIGLKKYSYVSLFGINSLDTLKFELFQNTVDNKLIGQKEDFDGWIDNPIELTGNKARKWFGPASVFLENHASIPVEAIAFSRIGKTLICLDDLERKGTDLDLKDVLGLASLLREKKECKVVLLLNNNVQGLDDYDTYAEKVVDIGLVFSPTAAECADIAFTSTSDEYELLKIYSEKLNIQNIRILKKIERLYLSAKSLLEGMETKVKEQFIRSLILFYWSHTSPQNDERVPTYEYLKNIGNLSFFKKQEREPKEKYWGSFLDNYGHGIMDDLDEVIAKSVRSGYFVNQEILSELKKKNNVVKSGDSEEILNGIWGLFNNVFSVQADELVTKINQLFSADVRNISIKSLNSAVELLRLIEKPIEASEIIDKYIDVLERQPESFDLNYFMGNRQVIDSEVKEKFDKNFVELSFREETVEEILRRRSYDYSWSVNDLTLFASFSTDEYYQLFTESLKGENIAIYVYRILEFSNLDGLDEEKEKIRNSVSGAIKKMSSESKLNEMRVQRISHLLEKKLH